MRIIQVVSSMAEGDGVTNGVLGIKKILDKNNIINEIWTPCVLRGLQDVDIQIVCNICNDMFLIDDILIYHFASGSELNIIVERLNVKKILMYQNVTPPYFFRGIEKNMFVGCMWGQYDAKQTVGNYVKAIVPSDYSKSELISYGWKKEHIKVIPVFSLEIGNGKFDESIFEKYNDGYINFLYTGRMVPNKKVEDVIKVFNYYKHNVNNNSRLFLIGSNGPEKYMEALKSYISRNNIQNIIFTGHVSNEELEAYYKIASVYLCMSEHEGFCIPVLEAFKRGVPVIAYDCTAVGGTMGKAGIHVKEKNEREISDIITKIVNEEEYRTEIIENQYKRAKEFNIISYESNIITLLNDVQLLELSNRNDTDFVTTEMSYKAKESFVVYGYGKIGKAFVQESLTLKDKILVAICDNKIHGDNSISIPFYNHDNCVKAFPDNKYIITVQQGFVDIVASLVKDGIDINNIYYYDSVRKCIRR